MFSFIKTLSNVISWIVTPCSLVGGYQCFLRKVGDKITRCHNPEDHNNYTRILLVKMDLDFKRYKIKSIQALISRSK
jgi:hypothetical protein